MKRNSDVIMKIGILTYHRAENYGAMLQAYALRKYLLGLGHDVSFVDYWPSYHVNYFKIFSWDRFKKANWKGKIVYLLGATVWLCPRMTRSKRLQRFIHERLGVTGKPRYNENTKATEHYDVVVYGSDQIWRKQNMGGVGFDDWYFGAENVVADKKIVYAGSMGTVKTTEKDDAYVKKMMQNFERISVREADLDSYLKGLGVASQQVIDPVFLLSKEEWEAVADKKQEKRKYILFYNLLNKPESVRFAERLSKETGLPIKELNKKMSFKHLGKRYISGASVEEFLRMIKDAEYVVSNSFHGVAFSLIFQRHFYAVGMGERANRVKTLLSSSGIPERYVAESKVSSLHLKPIDYFSVNEKMKNVIGTSKQFLNSSI